jgi:hypothetical protein
LIFQTFQKSSVLIQAKHVHAKFQLSIFYPDGLRQMFHLFSRKF